MRLNKTIIIKICNEIVMSSLVFFFVNFFLEMYVCF